MNFALYAGFEGILAKKGVDAVIEFAKKHGYSSVEFLRAAPRDSNLIASNPKDAKEFKKVLHSAGLSVACYSVYADVKKPATKQGLLDHLEIVAELESPFLHHTLLPQLVEPDPAGYEESMKLATDVAITVANRAKELGIRCIYEDQGFYVNGVEGFGRFYNTVKQACSNVGVCMDFGNILFADVAPEVFFEAYKEDVVHIHVKDYLRKKMLVAPAKNWLPAANGNWLRDTVVGDGVIDFAACMKIVNEIGYRGAFALENGHPEPFEAGIAQAMQLLTELYDPQ